MEVEAKFAADADAMRRLGAAKSLGHFSLGEARAVEFDDTYLDTPDEALLRAGYACRQRQGDRGLAIQVKSVSSGGGGVHRRQELEVLLRHDSAPGDWPMSEARDLVLGIAGDSPLQPLTRLHQRRLLRPVQQGEREVAELSLDQVVVQTADGALPPYHEVEVELRPAGTEEDLAAIASVLHDEYGLPAEERAKFTRALEAIGRPAGGHLLSEKARATLQSAAEGRGEAARRARALLALDEGLTQAQAGELLGVTSRTVRRWLRAYRAQTEERSAPAPAAPAGAPAEPARPAHPRPSPPGIALDDTMATAAMKTLRFHFHRMLDHEKGTRSGEDPEDLHDMRVATRRMRAALRVFEGHYDPAPLGPIARGLRKTGRALGAVRDLDVFAEKMAHYVESLPKERQHELDSLRDAWNSERDDARARMLAYLDGDYGRFVQRFGDLLADPRAAELPPYSPAGDVLTRRVVDVLPAVVYARAGTVWSYAVPLSQPNAPLLRYHRLRIASKFLRYSLEFFEEVLDPQAKHLIKTMKGLQDHLGDLQDAVVACGVLRTFLTWGSWRPPEGGTRRSATGVVAPGVAAYLAYRQQEMQRLLDEFPEVWEKVSGPDFAAQLGEVLLAVRARRH
jgi:CHAD domain-containing protein